MTEEMGELLQKGLKVFEYIESKTDAKTALNMTKNFGFDSPGVLRSRSYEDFVRIVDKLLLARKLMGK